MVSGAASVSMYSVSEAAGSLVPVLAQSRRCVLAPAAASRRHRGDASRPRYALYVRLATAIPRRRPLRFVFMLGSAPFGGVDPQLLALTIATCVIR